jgi:hypothetical protein
MPIEPAPPETARIARVALPTGDRFLRVADELDMLFTDEAFLALIPHMARTSWVIVTFDTDVKIARADFHPWWCIPFMTTAGEV